MQAYLRVVSGPDAGRTFDLTEGVKLLIGRGEKSDTRLADGSVSRIHCELQWDGGQFTLVDMGSAGGTLVDGKKITLHHLKHGQEFQVGGTRLVLHTTGIADASTLLASQRPTRAIKADEEVLTGQTISHYELGQPLPRGRSGTIYKAHDTRDGKEVAFKVLHADFASDPEDVQRFIRAMTTVVDLHHPNLIELYGAGKRGDTCWIAMEYVDGEPLTKLIEKFGTLKMLD
jgi:pSer/pThr/pTyr-binding forkhead associated (FHA) protein